MNAIEESDILEALAFVESEGPVTTQQVTEYMYGCRKPDDMYNANVEYVTSIMQWLKRHHRIVGERVPTGRGNIINVWRVADGSE